MAKNQRKVLVLKEKYKGSVVKKTIPKMGEITMDTNSITVSEYPNFVRMGFAECFEEKEQEEATAEAVAEALAASKRVEASDDEEEEFEDLSGDEDEDEDDTDEGDDTDEDEEGDETDGKAVLTEGDAEADLEGKTRPNNPIKEGLMSMAWNDFKVLAKEHGERVNGRRREDVAESILAKIKA